MLLSRSLNAAILASACLLGGCDRESGQTAQPAASASASAPLSGTIDRSHKGSAIPDLVFKDAGGKELRLASLKGKPLLVNLWATWCAPCVAELPMLDKLAQQGQVRVLTVSQDLGKPDQVAAFLKDKGGAALEPWLDPENELSFHYGSGTLPTTVYYDVQGREVWRFVGGHDWGNAETVKMLAEAG